MTTLGEPFAVALEVTLRHCTEDDLRHLEWFGLYTVHREIFELAWQRHLAGNEVMLVADVKGFPVGQIWIDLAKYRAERVGFLWAARVMPPLQSHGIGARLLAAAETELRQREYVAVELGVHDCNEPARRFYERWGYRVVGTTEEEQVYTTPDGEVVRFPMSQCVMRKELGEAPHRGKRRKGGERSPAEPRKRSTQSEGRTARRARRAQPPREVA